jgi:uncharacterized protein YkwD
MARKALAPALLVLLIAIGMDSSGAAGAPAAACQDTDRRAAELTLQQVDDSMFCLVNRRRAAYGRGEVTRNPILRRAASKYASSLLQGHFFSHHGDFGGRSTGSTVIGRLREMGYIRRGYVWNVGENLRWATPDRSTPADVVEAWMTSAIHRKFLLNPKFQELGVAAQRGTPFGPTQTDGVTVASEFGFRQVRAGRR